MKSKKNSRPMISQDWVQQFDKWTIASHNLIRVPLGPVIKSRGDILAHRGKSSYLNCPTLLSVWLMLFGRQEHFKLGVSYFAESTAYWAQPPKCFNPSFSTGSDSHTMSQSHTQWTGLGGLAFSKHGRIGSTRVLSPCSTTAEDNWKKK